MKKYTLIILSLFFTSCSYTNTLAYFNNNQIEEYQSIGVKLLWSTDIGQERSFKTGTLQPIFSENNSYTIDSEGLITSIDLSSGKIKWIHDLDLDVSSGLTLHNDMLFFGTNDGKYHGYKMDDLTSSYEASSLSFFSSCSSGFSSVVSFLFSSTMGDSSTLSKTSSSYFFSGVASSDFSEGAFSDSDFSSYLSESSFYDGSFSSSLF